MEGDELSPTSTPSQLIACIRRLPISLALLFAWAGVSAQALTAEQARDLPEQELARQALGDAGNLFVEVRRPDWQDGAWLVANPRIAGKAPPLRWLVFYGRPYNLSSSGVEGLCGAQQLQVYFSKEGAVASLGHNTVVGFAPPVTFGNAFPGLPHQSGLEQRCATVSAQNFFYSKDSIDLGSAVDAVNRVHEAMVHGGAPWLTLTCDLMAPFCDVAHYVDRVAIESIHSLDDCRPGWEAGDSSRPKDRCLLVHLGASACMTQETLTIILDGKSDPAEIRSAAFREDRIVC